MRFRRTKNHQAGPDGTGVTVVAASPRRPNRAGLVQRLRGALVRRHVTKAIATVAAGPVAAALVVGLALGLVIGAALMLSAIASAARESQ